MSKWSGARMLGLAMVPLAAACSHAAMQPGMLTPRQQAEVSAHAMVSASDASEIQQGQLAVERAQNANVRSFAQRMVADHSSALQLRDRQLAGTGRGLRMGTVAMANAGGQNVGSASVTADVSTLQAVNGGTVAGSGRGDAFMADVVTTPSGMTDLNTVLVNNPASREMVRMSLGDLQQLQQMSGMAFDRAYMDKQVMAHQNALNTIDTLLARTDLSNDLRAILVTQRGAVAMHLQMAQQLRGQL